MTFNSKPKLPDSTNKDVILDEAELSLSHQEIIKQSLILKKIYNRWYNLIKAKLPNNDSQTVLEIGSGGGFIKQIIPNTITSDILPLNHVDMRIDATFLPFLDDSLDAIVMINVFHHIPNCAKFLSEAQRTLKVGGKVIMIEPSNCFWSRVIYKNLHHEPFEPTTLDWQFASTGPLSSSNQALPYIVFERDRHLFEKRFKRLSIKSITYYNPFIYLLSGGLSKPSFIPKFLHKLVMKFDDFAASNHLHMFNLIELQKV